jgi:hypothetical protein
MEVAGRGLLLHLFGLFIPVEGWIGWLVGELGLGEVVEFDGGGRGDIFGLLGGLPDALTHVVIFYL